MLLVLLLSVEFWCYSLGCVAILVSMGLCCWFGCYLAGFAAVAAFVAPVGFVAMLLVLYLLFCLSMAPQFCCYSV